MYTRIESKKLTGQELFINTGLKKFAVLDFWQYAFSILNDNILRGKLAEFLVEVALKDLDDVGIRGTWGDFDVEDFDGTKIEVKCSAYIQDYDQEDYSQVKFSGLKAKQVYYSKAVHEYRELAAADYKADMYILILQHHKDHSTYDILDMNQWSFYVLTRARISEITKNGKSVSVKKLTEHGILPVSFEALHKTVDDLKS